MLWWGRIGKLAQFIGALTVVLDLIGPDRLRAWGLTLHARSDSTIMQRLSKTLKRTYEVIVAVLRFAILPEPGVGTTDEDERRTRDAIERLKRAGVGLPTMAFATLTGLLVIVGGIALAKNIGLDAWFSDHVWAKWLFSILFIIVLAVLGPFVIALWYGIIRGSLLSAGVVIDYALVRPVAAALNTAHPGVSVKWLGVTLLVVGFHFDLLAS
ncbi:hypothetical protein ABGB08_41250 [Acrocarpospora sp. B8E8]